MTEPSKGGTPWSAEETALLVQHTDQGIGRVETARRLGRTPISVYHKVRKMRLDRPPAGSKGTTWATDRLREAEKLRDSGVTYRAIAEQFGATGSLGALYSGLARMKKRAAQRETR